MCANGCEKEVYCKGLCKSCYAKNWRAKKSKGPGRCKCGCGKKIPKKYGSRLLYASQACYPKYKTRKLKGDKFVEKLCKCGCGRYFTDTTHNQLRKYYEPECNVKQRDEEDDIKEAVFRQTLCRGFDMDGGGYYRGMCIDYERCLDKAFHGGLFKYEKNKGRNCYKHNGKVDRVNYGTSGAMCSENY